MEVFIPMWLINMAIAFGSMLFWIGLFKLGGKLLNWWIWRKGYICVLPDDR